jgi:putative transposase
MKKSRFSEQQITYILRQAEEGTSVEEVCRKAGISEATYYNWRKKYGGLMPSEMKRLKQLDEENRRLRKLVADLSLDKEMLQDVIRRKIRSLPGCARWSITFARPGRSAFDGPAVLCRSSVRAITIVPAVPGRLPSASASRRSPRRACATANRRIHVLLCREGWQVNVKRVCRLYREQSLQLRNKSPKRRVKAKLREDRSPATEANQVWAMDFVHDQLGRKIRALTVVDIFIRLAPAIEVRQSWRGSDVVAALDRAALEAGYPGTIRLDNVLSDESIATD